MVVVLLSRVTVDRRALGLVGAGVATIAVADSAFLYLTSLDRYDTGLHLVGLGWATGFVLITCGALAAVDGVELPHTAGATDRRTSLLPYAPVLLAVGIAVTDTPGGAQWSLTRHDHGDPAVPDEN